MTQIVVGEDVAVNDYRIVVGVDGSENSRWALQWALGEATVHGGSVEVVTCVKTGASHRHQLTADSVDAMTADAQAILDRLVQEESSNEMVNCDVTSKVTTTGTGGVADALMADAADADLLVVGSRGLGGAQALLLGSFSRRCAERSPVPLVIVPSQTSG